MRKQLIKLLQTLAFDTVAAEIAEAAVVLPLLFMVLLGIYWFGQAFRIYGTITHAAQEGARAAAAPVCSTCTSGSTPAGRASGAVRSVLLAANLAPLNLSRPSPVPTFLSCLPGGAAPACESADPNICVQLNVELSDPATGGTGLCGVSVTFHYPFQFWLPFTTLNQQRIKIPAAARVREENQ